MGNDPYDYFENDFYDDYEPDPPDKQYCTICDEYIEPYFEDEGIGDYEYWGCKGRDVQLVAYCPLCENPLE